MSEPSALTLIASRCSIGKMGTVVTYVANASSDGQTPIMPPPALPLFVIVLDRSGSMGDNVGKAARAIGNGLHASGASGPVKLITFDSKIECIDTSVERLQVATYEARGTTLLAGVAPVLRTILTDSASAKRHVHIIALSDGAVYDMDAAVSAMATLEPIARERTMPTTTTVIRLKTSDSPPDTRAMSCMLALDTSSTTNTVVDIHASDALIGIRDAIRAACVRAGTSIGSDGVYNNAAVMLVAPSASLYRIPCTPPLQTIAMHDGTSVLLAPDIDPSLLVWTSLADETVPVRVSWRESGDMNTFLHKLDAHIRVSIVQASAASKILLTNLVSWCDDVLAELACADAAAASAAIIASGGSHIRARDRARALRTSLTKATKATIAELKQLASQQKTSVLQNAQSSADFLRTSSISTALAKRVSNTIDIGQMDQTARDAVIAVNTHFTHLPAAEFDAPTTVSFYSQDTAEAALLALQELSLADIQSSNAIDLLAVGAAGLGLPLRLRQYDAIDPWTLSIDYVYTTGELMLTEADVISVAQSTNDRDALAYPYADADGIASVNAVVPLRSAMGARVHDAYMRGPGRTLATLACSIGIRGLLGPVPFDLDARAAAALYWVMTNCARPFHAGDAAAFSALSTEVAWFMNGTRAFDALAAWMSNTDNDPRAAWHSGMSTILKPFAVLAGHAACAPIRASTPALMRMLLHLWDFQSYRAAAVEFRRFGQTELGVREAALLAVLGLHQFASFNDAMSSQSEPFTADDPFIAHPLSADWLVPSWLPSIAPLDAVGSCIAGDAWDSATFLREATTCKRAIAVTSIMCACEKDRLVVPPADDPTQIAGTMHVPDLIGGSAELQFAFCERVLRDKLRVAYDERLGQKRAREAQLRIEETLNTVLATTSMKAFASALNTVLPSRNAPGFKYLCDRLCDNMCVVPLRFDKIWLVIFGSFQPEASADSELLLFASGNRIDGSLATFNKVYADLGALEIWTRVQFEWRNAKTTHTYRATGKPNRHSHSADKPSFFHFGYTSLEAFEEHNRVRAPDGSITMSAVWNDYVKVHVDCCGFGRRRNAKTL